MSNNHVFGDSTFFFPPLLVYIFKLNFNCSAFNLTKSFAFNQAAAIFYRRLTLLNRHRGWMKASSGGVCVCVCGGSGCGFRKKEGASSTSTALSLSKTKSFPLRPLGAALHTLSLIVRLSAVFCFPSLKAKPCLFPSLPNEASVGDG